MLKSLPFNALLIVINKCTIVTKLNIMFNFLIVKYYNKSYLLVNVINYFQLYISTSFCGLMTDDNMRVNNCYKFLEC